MNNHLECPRHPRANVLIVDSVSAVGFVLSELLSRKGYASDIAANGREALSLAESARWDVVVLDIVLPDIGGIELYGRLNRASNRRHLPVIFITGYHEDTLRPAREQAPWASLLLKPFSMDRFLAALENCLRAPSD